LLANQKCSFSGEKVHVKNTFDQAKTLDFGQKDMI
jgi:hypothetical protein